MVTVRFYGEFETVRDSVQVRHWKCVGSDPCIGYPNSVTARAHREGELQSSGGRKVYRG